MIRNGISMRGVMFLVVMMTVFIMVPACTSHDEGEAFDIRKGVNISCWLSQTASRKGPVETYFTEQDVRRLAEWGFDHIRLPIDEKEILTEELGWIDPSRQLIHKAIGWCEKYDMRVILDLHILRSHYFNDSAHMTLWKEKSDQDRMMKIWKLLSDEFKHYPVSLLAYELLNEPVPDTPEQWNDLSARLIAQIRKTEPKRMIIVDPGSHASIGALPTLSLPENDRNLMFAVHFYTPHLLTHYRARWWAAMKDLTIPINYPGQLVAKEIVDTIKNKENLRVVNYYNGYYDKAVLAEKLEMAFEKSRQTGLKFLISEVGCIDNTPEEPKINWCTDIAAICRERHVAFSIWGFKASFGLFNDDGTVKDKRLMEAFVK